MAPLALQDLGQLPALCDAKDLARVFGVALNTVYDWRKQGKLRRFEVKRPIGPRRWSGARVREYVETTTVTEFAARKAG